MRFFLILTLCVYSIYAKISDFAPLTDEIVNAINALNTTWKAGKNFNGSSSIQIDELIFTQDISDYYIKDLPTEEYFPYVLPDNFDAREAWPNCTSIGKVYDQTKGYPSWIYPVVGVIADRLCIKHGVEIDVEATVDQLVRSSGYNGSNSANIGRALEYWSKHGIFTVESLHDSKDCLPFPQECQSNKIQNNRYFNVTNRANRFTVNSMNDIKLNGPRPVYFAVYSDFLSYKSGIYRRSSDKLLGVQNLKLIGWGTENGVDYYLATNSWGTDWGENGFVKIERVNLAFGTVPYSISPLISSVDISEDVPRSYVIEQLFYLTK